MTIYGDEEIIKLLNSYKKESIGNVYAGIKIKGDLYHFHEYFFGNKKVSMMLPLRFVDMPEEILNIKYGHISKPNILKCSKDYNIDIMLNWTEEKLNEYEIEKKVDEQLKILKTIQPAYEIYEKGRTWVYKARD